MPLDKIRDILGQVDEKTTHQTIKEKDELILNQYSFQPQIHNKRQEPYKFIAPAPE